MEKLNTNEIIDHLGARGIKVVKTSYADLKSIKLLGDIDSFIYAAKAFNENVVLMHEFTFDADDFLHQTDKPILGEYAEPAGADGINLVQFLPELEEYKIYNDETSLLVFQVFYQNKIFAYWHKAEWFGKFSELFEEAQRIFEKKEQDIEVQRTELENTMREERDRRESLLRNLLEGLAEDEKFTSLPTQKAKQEYALARHPELGELSSHALKIEISNLIARIQAKKML